MGYSVVISDTELPNALTIQSQIIYQRTLQDVPLKDSIPEIQNYVFDALEKRKRLGVFDAFGVLT